MKIDSPGTGFVLSQIGTYDENKQYVSSIRSDHIAAGRPPNISQNVSSDDGIQVARLAGLVAPYLLVAPAIAFDFSGESALYAAAIADAGIRSFNTVRGLHNYYIDSDVAIDHNTGGAPTIWTSEVPLFNSGLLGLVKEPIRKYASRIWNPDFSYDSSVRQAIARNTHSDAEFK